MTDHELDDIAQIILTMAGCVALLGLVAASFAYPWVLAVLCGVPVMWAAVRVLRRWGKP